MSSSHPNGRADAGPQPVLVLDLELGAPLPAVSSAQGRYRRALVHARLHEVPLGLVQIELEADGLSEDGLAAALWPAVRAAATSHLAADGEPAPDHLSVGGLPRHGACVARRAAFLQHAPELTVVVPTRERPLLLRRCLEAIWAGSYPPDRVEVIVVDNWPQTDATRELVAAQAREHPVHYLRENQRGSASARNTGVAAAASELLAFTDDDGVPDRHWLTELAREYARTPEAGSVSGLLLPLELETPAQLWFEQYGGFSRGFSRVVYDLDRHRPPDSPLYPYTAGVFGTGNNMSFRRSVLQAIGGFDPALGNGTPALGGVDSEVLLRTVLAGNTLVYQPDALVWHEHRPDYAGLRRQIYSYGVGLTAYQLKTVLADPRRVLPDVARRLPAALRFALSPRSALNANKQADYPRELTRLERRGMVYGPLAYWRSRRRYGPHRVPGQAR